MKRLFILILILCLTLVGCKGASTSIFPKDSEGTPLALAIVNGEQHALEAFPEQNQTQVIHSQFTDEVEIYLPVKYQGRSWMVAEDKDVEVLIYQKIENAKQNNNYAKGQVLASHDLIYFKIRGKGQIVLKYYETKDSGLSFVDTPSKYSIVIMGGE